MDLFKDQTQPKFFDWTLMAVGGVLAVAGTFAVKLVGGMLAGKKVTTSAKK